MQKMCEKYYFAVILGVFPVHLWTTSRSLKRQHSIEIILNSPFWFAIQSPLLLTKVFIEISWKYKEQNTEYVFGIQKSLYYQCNSFYCCRYRSSLCLFFWIKMNFCVRIYACREKEFMVYLGKQCAIAGAPTEKNSTANDNFIALSFQGIKLEM